MNSGNFRMDDNAEETAYQMNLRAAEEICRQIRLRDLGGVIVNDFIDMRDERHRRGVEHHFRDLLRRDRARTKALRISPFGLIEMTRQRIRPSLRRSVFENCPCCAAVGLVKTAESVAIEVMRLLMTVAQREGVRKIAIDVHERVANYLNNRRRREINQLEDVGGLVITVTARTDVSPNHLDCQTQDDSGSVTRIPVGIDSKSR